MCTWVFSQDNACQPTGSPEDYAPEEGEVVPFFLKFSCCLEKG